MIEFKPEDKFGAEYNKHSVFEQLEKYSSFYDYLAIITMDFYPIEDSFDTYTYSSIKGTIESIKDTLKKGRINDSYALLRKYYDSTIINTYAKIYISENYEKENFAITIIENWKKGIEKIPEYRVMSKYIKESPRLAPINNLLKRDNRYKIIRDRCNDHTHYNFFKHLLLNDNEIYNPNRVKYLNRFAQDIEDIFIQHFAYIFYLNDYYMMSSDYIDCLDMEIEPEKDSQYRVAPFIQELFDEIIKPKRYDIAKEIKEKTCMQLKL